MNSTDKEARTEEEIASEEAAKAAAMAAAEAAGEDADDGSNAETGESDPAALEQQLAEMKEKLLRSMADNENLRRRAQREKEDASKYAISNFARDLCEIADNLRRAIDSVPEERRQDEAVKPLLEGVEMTEKALLNLFERYGIRPVHPHGEKFDPNLHEALSEAHDEEAAPGTVLHVIQTGYAIKDRLLRPARVVVAKAPPKNNVDTSA